MNDILTDILASPKYRDVVPEAALRVFEQEEKKYKKRADLDKAVRRRLHALTGAFFAPEEKKRAAELLNGPYSPEALAALLNTHASTRERMPQDRYALLFDRIRSATDGMGKTLDLACGLNPLYLGARGITVHGADLDLGAVRLIGTAAGKWGLPVSAEGMDLMNARPEGEYDTALFFKLLPILETEKKGAGAALFRDVRARFKVVSFPTRSLGGRRCGMAENYGRWFDENAAADITVLDRFETENELVIITEAR